jgi:hypothetical protein
MMGAGKFSIVTSISQYRCYVPHFLKTGSAELKVWFSLAVSNTFMNSQSGNTWKKRKSKKRYLDMRSITVSRWMSGSEYTAIENTGNEVRHPIS